MTSTSAYLIYAGAKAYTRKNGTSTEYLVLSFTRPTYTAQTNGNHDGKGFFKVYASSGKEQYMIDRLYDACGVPVDMSLGVLAEAINEVEIFNVSFKPTTHRNKVGTLDHISKHNEWNHAYTDVSCYETSRAWMQQADNYLLTMYKSNRGRPKVAIKAPRKKYSRTSEANALARAVLPDDRAWMMADEGPYPYILDGELCTSPIPLAIHVAAAKSLYDRLKEVKRTA